MVIRARWLEKEHCASNELVFLLLCPYLVCISISSGRMGTHNDTSQSGFPDAAGKVILSNFGSVSRDTDSAEPPSVDGLVLDTLEDPPRKE